MKDKILTSVIKRNNEITSFDKSKIKSAISNAFIDVDLKLDENSNGIINRIADSIENLNRELNVEEIQDIIENKLMSSNRKDVAKAFMLFREKARLEREGELSTLFDRMRDILEDGDDENSNKDYTLQSVKRDTIAGEFFRYDLKNHMPKSVYEAHKSKSLWLHDSDVQTTLTNCCLANIEDMLENGTRITNADIEQPNSIQTAMNVSTQIMASISSNQFGGVSFSNFNEVLAKYAKKNFIKNFETIYSTKLRRFLFKQPKNITSDMKFNWIEKIIYGSSFKFAMNNTDKQIYDSCQLFEYQTNSVLGSASQTPFSTITFNIPTSWESERLIMNYLKVRQKGLGKKGTIALFPKLSMIVVDGYNLKETDPYFYILEEASKCIAKTYYPDILTYSKEDYDSGKYYGRMGCRSRVNHEFKDENGNYMQHSRFNYGVVTNNIVRLALETVKQNGDEELFFKLFEEKYSLMKLALESKYKNVRKMKAKDSPILFMYGGICRLSPEQSIEHLLKSDQASLSYGWFGLDDTVRLLTNNEENISTEKGSKLGDRIMKALREQADRIKSETKLPVSLYASPLEAGVHTFFVGDKILYEDVMPDWLKNRGYYTNSFHFSSEVPIDSFDKIKAESKFIHYNNGGNISYVENGGKVYNNKTIIELIQYAYVCKTEYFACNTISDICYECGYVGEVIYNEDEHNYICPNCNNSEGSKLKVQRRSCGYISNYNITHAKSGRMKEIKNRTKHFNN